MPTKFVEQSSTLVPRYLIPKPVDVKAAIAWGAVLGVGALWMVQPFDWIKAQLNPPKDE